MSIVRLTTGVDKLDNPQKKMNECGPFGSLRDQYCFLPVYVAIFYLRNVFHRDSFVFILVCFIFFVEMSNYCIRFSMFAHSPSQDRNGIDS